MILTIYKETLHSCGCACELARNLAQPQRTTLETIPTCYKKSHPQLPDATVSASPDRGAYCKRNRLSNA
eukprot:6207762-Pleurochrysis_carterae.AAC.1